MIPMDIKKLRYALAMALGIALGAASEVRAEESSEQDCHVNVNTDSGNGGWQTKQCGHSFSVGFGGPIRDVDLDHPVGKGKAFIPQAGRDIEGAAHALGHGAEEVGQWLGKRLGL